MVIDTTHLDSCSSEFREVVMPLYNLIKAIFFEDHQCGISDKATCLSDIMYTWKTLHSHTLPVAPPSQLSTFGFRYSIYHICTIFSYIPNK